MPKMRAVRLSVRLMPWVVLSGLVVVLNAAPNGDATRLLRSPTVSATQIAFAYANNIWVVERAGGLARRLTSFQGQTTNPHFSPDGQWIAFSGEYAGNTDVYVVPAEGGEPKRLTWHPGRRRRAGLDARRQGGHVRVRARDAGRPSGARGSGRCRPRAASSSRCRCRAATRARFRPSGTAHRLPHEQLVGRGASQLSRRSEPADLDRRPQDLRSRLAAVDRLEGHRSGVGRATRCTSSPIATASSNVWAFDTKAKKLTQTTKFTDFDVKSIDAGAGAVVFEQAGRIHELDPKSGKSAGRRHHRARRLSVDDAALGRRHQPHDEHRPLADRQARRRRSARRDLHDPRREGRRPEPHELERLGRARAGVVAGRQVGFVFQRQVGRVQARSSSRRTAWRRRARSRSPNPTHYYTPSWSPDSKKLLYQRHRI